MVKHQDTENKDHIFDSGIHTIISTVPHYCIVCITVYIYTCILQFAGPDLDRETTTLQRRTRRKVFFQTLKVIYLNLYFFSMY